MLYFGLEFYIDCTRNVICADDHPDLSKPIVDCLNESGVDWVHDYYFPGSDYYCVVRCEDESDLDKIDLSKLDERYTKKPFARFQLDPQSMTISDVTVAEEFDLTKERIARYQSQVEKNTAQG